MESSDNLHDIDNLENGNMACQCFLVGAGYVALAAVAYRLLTIFSNILGPYVLLSPIDLKKRAGASWAVVTGATDGIGKAYAFELARRGFNVLLVSRTQSKLDETKKEILEKYSSIEVRTAAFDFTNAAPSAYKDLLATLNQVEIGVLINNVGMSYEYPDVLHKVDGGIERLANITTINTLPPTLLSAGILPQMVARKAGVIVNVGSSAGANQMALWAVYSATKKYVSWLTAILRKEYEHQGITVQTIAPMMVATKMSKVKRTSFFTPDGAVFAKSALNTVGNTSDTTGYITHQLQLELMDLIPTFIRDKILTNMSVGTRAAALRKKEREAKSQ
ncbi:Very-long-chain 3-oxooacyl-coA reductase let-767 [Caenorhabditis elegans]|nr:Very-long-chain 3-oxooacyl-coA reductase let-767 [Caenorhabditis elegans]CCD66339.1 Very-long-chain 3-oxooacyl-coA reductase let-767 [Caenorhabditis elegans]|eukprot:NP_001254935.1 Very-long-chain 3-oxooacyl-coA reductase let-767 [Caenorhabditis elegans]